MYGPKTASGWGTGIVLKGATGTANVIYSAWGYASNPRDTTIDKSKLWVVNFPALALSQADLGTASRQVYLQFGGGEEVLPYIASAGSVNSTLSFIPEKGTILIKRFTSDNSGSIEIPLSLQYRYVIIPGGVQGSSIIDPYATHLGAFFWTPVFISSSVYILYVLLVLKVLLLQSEYHIYFCQCHQTAGYHFLKTEGQYE